MLHAMGHMALFLGDGVGHGGLVADVLVRAAATDHTIDRDRLQSMWAVILGRLVGIDFGLRRGGLRCSGAAVIRPRAAISANPLNLYIMSLAFAGFYWSFAEAGRCVQHFQVKVVGSEA